MFSLSDLHVKNKKGFVSEDIKTSNILSGKAIYSQYCASCHGDDGKKGLSGAKDLGSSDLSNDESLLVITEGRKNMMAYKGQLSKEQINLVNRYIQGFKKEF